MFLFLCLRHGSDSITDQNLWNWDLVVWSLGNIWRNFRWALPCRHTTLPSVNLLMTPVLVVWDLQPTR